MPDMRAFELTDGSHISRQRLGALHLVEVHLFSSQPYGISRILHLSRKDSKSPLNKVLELTQASEANGNPLMPLVGDLSGRFRLPNRSIYLDWTPDLTTRVVYTNQTCA